MKQEFLEFLESLMKAAPEVVNEKMTDNVKRFIETLSEVEVDKPIITDNGKVILDYMQKATGTPIMKAKDIADGLLVSSRKVSGGLRKLVTDGFVEKVGKDPVIYALTEKGKNFIIE